MIETGRGARHQAGPANFVDLQAAQRSLMTNGQPHRIELRDTPAEAAPLVETIAETPRSVHAVAATSPEPA